MELKHYVKDGDIVLLYSDGLADNLYDKEFTSCIEGDITPRSAAPGLQIPEIKNKRQVAECLAKKAYKSSK